MSIRSESETIDLMKIGYTYVGLVNHCDVLILLFGFVCCLFVIMCETRGYYCTYLPTREFGQVVVPLTTPSLDTHNCTTIGV